MFDKTITIDWQGEETIVPVNMLLVEKVDRELNIMKLAVELVSGPEITRVAKLIYILLNHGGSELTHEEVYSRLFGKRGDEALKVLALANTILAALSPEMDVEDVDVEDDMTDNEKKSESD